MKKLYSLMLVIATVFVSCSQIDELLTENNGNTQVTFSLTADGVEQTRAGESMRYVMAIYDETETNVVLAETEFTSSSFAVRLDPGKYTCLFWADYGSANYDATNLKNVALKDDATNMEAFFAKQGITVTDGGTVNVTLHRAVAKVVLKETDRLEPGSITVTYNGFKGFDVSEGNVIDETAFTKTFTIGNVVESSVSSPTAVGEFLLLADADERVLADFKVQYNSEAEKTVTNVPVQANYVTNINGKFSVNVSQQFTIIVDDSWATPDKDVDLIPYVTFSAESEQTFTMNLAAVPGKPFTLGDNEYFEYSVGDGGWTRFTSTVSDIAFGGTHGSLRLRGKSHTGTGAGFNSYTAISFGTANVLVDCKGDIRTLIDYENHETVNTADARFFALFYNNSQLKTAPELPATTLSVGCYYGMFAGCSSLTEAPKLPAVTLKESCYISMFSNCTSLTKAPALPATTLTTECYVGMFTGCTSLTNAPELPATNLASKCYHSMFEGCTSLTTAPALPATTLATECYYSMFEGCTSLTKVPELSATNMEVACYKCMFYGCSSLKKAPALNSRSLAISCYYGMFWGCSSLIEAPALPATSLAQSCYITMFKDCTSLTKAPELPATTLATSCYFEMFSGCAKLSEVTMLATNNITRVSIQDWLKDAGKEASTRSLTLANSQSYNDVLSWLPDNWKQGATGTTVNFKN